MFVSTPGLVVADVAGPDAVLPVVGSQAPGAVITEVSPLLPVASSTIVPVAVVTRVWSRPSEQGDGRERSYQIIVTTWRGLSNLSLITFLISPQVVKISCGVMLVCYNISEKLSTFPSQSQMECRIERER